MKAMAMSATALLAICMMGGATFAKKTAIVFKGDANAVNFARGLAREILTREVGEHASGPPANSSTEEKVIYHRNGTITVRLPVRYDSREVGIVGADAQLQDSLVVATFWFEAMTPRQRGRAFVPDAVGARVPVTDRQHVKLYSTHLYTPDMPRPRMKRVAVTGRRTTGF